jgi:hypothetical protein
LLQKAEEADNTEREEGQQLPDEIRRREVLKAKLDQARERLERRAKQRAEAEKAEYSRKVHAREQRKGRRKGKRIKPPDERPDPDDQINLSDSESHLMRKNKRSSYEQCYNGQAVVDTEGSQLVLAARVTQCPSDRNELSGNLEAIPEQVGKPSAVVADSGYACEDEVEKVQSEEIEVYVSTGAEGKHQRRRHDFRPSKRRSESPKEPKAQWLKAMKEKLETDTGRALYARRKQTAEPVFGIIKEVMGFRQFLLRGIEKVEGEWQLVTLAYNVKRLWKLQLALS